MTDSADKQEPQLEAHPLEGVVLLSEAKWDAEAFLAGMKEVWDFELTPDHKDPDAPIVFEFGGSVVAIKLMAEKLDAEVAASHAAMNPMWKEAGMMAKLHQAYIAVLAIPKSCSAMDNAAMIVKVLDVLSRQENAMAVDNGSTLLGPDGYREGASVMKHGELPIFNLVTFAIAREDEEKCVGVTMGMTMLGHRELEVLPVKAAPDTVQEFLYTIVEWSLKSGKEVEVGALLGLNPQNRHPVKLAESRLIPGLETLQIEL